MRLEFGYYDSTMNGHFTRTDWGHYAVTHENVHGGIDFKLSAYFDTGGEYSDEELRRLEVVEDSHNHFALLNLLKFIAQHRGVEEMVEALKNYEPVRGPSFEWDEA